MVHHAGLASLVPSSLYHHGLVLGVLSYGAFDATALGVFAFTTGANFNLGAGGSAITGGGGPIALAVVHLQWETM